MTAISSLTSWCTSMLFSRHDGRSDATASSVSYRVDIDGLRGIAILIVVLFHAWPTVVPGGYVGVDVFFVISGFLITRLIRPDIEAGTFSFIAFYERRVRRLAPAALALFAAVAAAAWCMLPPTMTLDLSKALMNSVLFAENIYAMDQTSYFAAASDTAPLNHIWSLSVEEQFYIVFPAFLILIARSSKLRFTPAILIFATMSFGLACALTMMADPSRAYFNPFARFWELAIGALLVFMPAWRRPVVNEIAAILGLTAIGTSAWLAGAGSGFPGPAALPATLGAAAIIQAGTHKLPRISNILTSRVIVGLGLISYSLYLWHWPLLAYARVLTDGRPTPAVTAIAILLSLGIAVLSYRYIEQPFRRRRDLFTRRRVFTGFVTVSLVLLAIAFAGQATNGFRDRLSPEVQATLRYARSNIWHGPGSTLSNWRPVDIGAPKAEPDFILVGNSHAQILVPVLEAIAKKNDVSGRMLSAIRCNFIEMKPSDPRPDYIKPPCAQVLFKIDELLSSLKTKPRIIYSTQLIMLWQQLTESNHDPAKELERTIVNWRQQGFPVTIVAPVPNPGFNVLAAYERAQFRNMAFDASLPFNTFFAEHEAILSTLERLAATQGVDVVYPHKVFCDTITCRLAIDGKPLFFDHNHLSRYGIERLSTMFDDLMHRIATERP